MGSETKDDCWIIHDGQLIEDVSEPLCALFRCERLALIDSPIENIIASEELRALARLRGQHIMNSPRSHEYKQQYDFLRFDGTRFWGEAHSNRLDENRYRTYVVRLYDIHEPGN